VNLTFFGGLDVCDWELLAGIDMDLLTVDDSDLSDNGVRVDVTLLRTHHIDFHIFAWNSDGCSDAGED
jgi:hypothetical protein